MESGLTAFQAYTFQGSKLKNITIPAILTIFNGHTHAFFDANPNLVIYVPDTAVSAYKAHSG
jgi:hypothetical protein